jgi:hypothetical protein
LIFIAKKDAIVVLGEAGGNTARAEIIQVDTIPEPYSPNGAFRLIVRAVADLSDNMLVDKNIDPAPEEPIFYEYNVPTETKATVQDTAEEAIDVESYRPEITRNVWQVSETDVKFIVEGAGVLGVGCVGEAACFELEMTAAIKRGNGIRIGNPKTVKIDDVICTATWIVWTYVLNHILLHELLTVSRVHPLFFMNA